MLKKLFCVMAVVVVLGGCATTGQEITNIDPGEGRGAVVAVLGRPDAVHVSGKYEIYSYLHRHRTWHSLHHTDYTVIMKDNHVVQFGPGHARRVGIHSWTIVPPWK